jgi:hypothetical protein
MDLTNQNDLSEQDKTIVAASGILVDISVIRIPRGRINAKIFTL